RSRIAEGGPRAGGPIAWGYELRVPLVDGTPVTRRDGEIAIAKARAKALNMASTQWWVLVPRSKSMCRFILAFSATLRKKCCTSSVSRFPMRDMGKAAL